MADNLLQKTAKAASRRYKIAKRIGERQTTYALYARFLSARR